MGVLDVLNPVLRFIPQVRPPSVSPSVKDRFIWTLIPLLLFFVMYNISAFGAYDARSAFDFLQMITASRIGSLITLGIGPIVLASIFLQLFVGAKILNINLSDPKEKEQFHEVQKLLAIVVAFIEAFIYVSTGKIILNEDMGIDLGLLAVIVTIQIVIGSIIIIYLDEVVSRYGIGSGISLFIAAGVSFSIIGGTISLFFGENGVIETISGGGAEAIPTSLFVLLPLFFTVFVFFIVVYAEGMKIEVPLAFERMRGVSPKLPIKFLYVSNIPVIFASALILNVQLFSVGLFSGRSFEIGGVDIVKIIGYVDSTNMLRDGLLYYITPLFSSTGTLAYFEFLTTAKTPIFGVPEYIHAIVYIIFLSLVSILFGVFWVETAGMDSKSVANQLNTSGLQVPGYRRDPRILEMILERYIPTIVIVGSFFVGFLAGFADLTGALGTGTGILLTVGIFHRMYEQMERMNITQLYPRAEALFGG